MHCDQTIAPAFGTIWRPSAGRLPRSSRWLLIAEAGKSYRRWTFGVEIAILMWMAILLVIAVIPN